MPNSSDPDLQQPIPPGRPTKESISQGREAALRQIKSWFRGGADAKQLNWQDPTKALVSDHLKLDTSTMSISATGAYVAARLKPKLRGRVGAPNVVIVHATTGAIVYGDQPGRSIRDMSTAKRYMAAFDALPIGTFASDIAHTLDRSMIQHAASTLNNARVINRYSSAAKAGVDIPVLPFGPRFTDSKDANAFWATGGDASLPDEVRDGLCQLAQQNQPVIVIEGLPIVAIATNNGNEYEVVDPNDGRPLVTDGELAELHLTRFDHRSQAMMFASEVANKLHWLDTEQSESLDSRLLILRAEFDQHISVNAVTPATTLLQSRMAAASTTPAPPQLTEVQQVLGGAQYRNGRPNALIKPGNAVQFIVEALPDGADLGQPAVVRGYVGKTDPRSPKTIDVVEGVYRLIGNPHEPVRPFDQSMRFDRSACSDFRFLNLASLEVDLTAARDVGHIAF